MRGVNSSSIEDGNPFLQSPPSSPGPALARSPGGPLPTWKLRVVYASTVGIVESEAKPWNLAAPLGIGQRSSSPDARPWLHVADERAAREHARLYRSPAGIVVEDLHSRSGTSVNGQRLRPCTPHPLRDGDLLRIGDAFVVLRHESDLADVPISGVVGVSRAARELRRALLRCALDTSPVLIRGEKGTGKTTAARLIHVLSQRPGSFVTMACAAADAASAEAQLFGATRSTKTGGAKQPGCFAEAQNGTLLLHDIAELVPELQLKLRQAIETGEIIPVGGRRARPAEVRLLTATEKDLELEKQRGSFSAELYDHLAAEVLTLPPLRTRCEDILLLCRHFAGSAFQPSPRLVAALLKHPFPYNLKELHAVVHRLGSASEAEVIASLTTPADQGADHPPC